MIWNIIRDFIVEYITGGMTSNGEWHSPTMGYVSVLNNGVRDDSYQAPFNDNYFYVGKDIEGLDNYLNGCDWLATTLTIICMCLIVAFAIWLVIWVFKAVAHAFLLRR